MGTLNLIGIIIQYWSLQSIFILTKIAGHLNMMIVNGLNPGVFISSLYFGIVWARLVLKRTVVGD